MKKIKRRIIILVSLFFLISLSYDVKKVKAQEQKITISANVDLRSRWIYRGIELGNSPQIQPSMALNISNFQIGIWGSHSLTLATDGEEPGAEYRETNLWAQYTFDLGRSTLTPYIQNHYNPANSFADFSSREGSHQLQAQLFWAGKEQLPLDAHIGVVFFGDDDTSIYLETGYTVNFRQFSIRNFVSGTPRRAQFNGTNGTAITMIGFNATRSIELSEKFNLPLSAEFILNPYELTTFASFIASFRF